MALKPKQKKTQKLGGLMGSVYGHVSLKASPCVISRRRGCVSFQGVCFGAAGCMFWCSGVCVLV